MCPPAEIRSRLGRGIWKAFAFGWIIVSLARGEVGVGDTFPALADSNVVALGGGALPATAGKVVLADFWASWCAPCKASFPALARLHDDFARDGLVIAAISVDEKAAAAQAFVRRHAPPFAALHDREQRLVRQVVVPTMPTSFVLDRSGRVRFVHAGFNGRTTEQELRRQIEALLKEE